MSEIAWEATKLFMWGIGSLALIGAFCAYGLYRMGPNDDIEGK